MSSSRNDYDSDTYDYWESFEELDNSLDKALASNNLLQNDLDWDHHQRKQTALDAIPLANLNMEYSSGIGAGEERSRNELGDGHERSPLEPRSSNELEQRRSKFGQVAAQIINFFKAARKELKDEKTRQHRTETTGTVEERFIEANGANTRELTYPNNALSNAKYNPITFIPIILYEQFKFFFNLYFLLVALSQIIPPLQIGYLSSYVVPLAFVLTVTMFKEASDDVARRRRDREQNYELYEVLNRVDMRRPSPVQEPVWIPSKDIRVGDVVRLSKGMRLPADMVLLQSSDSTGEVFIKTDQLDGETDWKLKVASNLSQRLSSINTIMDCVGLVIPNPTKSIHEFRGKLLYHPYGLNGWNISSTELTELPLTIEQALWANTVIALGSAVGMVVYTGVETRQMLNSSKSGVKTGLLELELNRLSKILCIVVFVLSFVLVIANGWPLKSDWYVDVVRFLILFSSIIPVSLRVNIDLAKSVYASQIQKDKEIENTIVRTSTIPEDLGRIEYLLSDKTGTLTQNDMELKKLHLGGIYYAADTMDIVSDYIKSNASTFIDTNKSLKLFNGGSSFKKQDLGSRVCELVLTLALCHNVTPMYEPDIGGPLYEITYQAASPDEIAIAKFTELVGLRLFKRDRHSITLLHVPLKQELKFEILHTFPFSSETKRMGILVKFTSNDQVWFMEKGADTVMADIVSYNDWLEEEVGNMAREGLRTLVIGCKRISKDIYDKFDKEYKEASLLMHERDALMLRVTKKYLENDVVLLGLTGVEDKLQKNVNSSIEILRNAGIKIWMLTGDKVETAKCVSINARIISRGQYVHQMTRVSDTDMALNHLDVLKNNLNSCLLIDGESLGVCVKNCKREFFEIAINLPAVIACRCSPQQKADIASIIRRMTGKRVCCIGDGGNDVNMIQSADVGVGIVGKEGKQASLSADFSVDQFCYLIKLLLWHGRNSYKRSAKLSQFVIHRGLLISVAQAVYSISSKFEPLALYQGWLMVGYSTIYTMAPVFSLTLDCDIREHLTKLYPELYRELTLGKSLSYRTFFVWVLISLFQGSVIQLASQLFQSLAEPHFPKLVAISFTCLICNELFMVALLINTWNRTMVVAIVTTAVIYAVSIPFLSDYFDLHYVASISFYWQSIVTLLVSLFPVWAWKYLSHRIRPPSYAKVQQD